MALVKFAYADPPYIGQAKKHYGKEASYAGEVDHAQLMARLVDEYPDGWALSLSSPTLPQILALCPDGVRVMAWVKPFASFKPNVGVAYCWEPVIVSGGRKRTRTQRTVRDYVSANITLRKGLSGAKPKEFCFWLFDVLNVQPDDVVDDLFPGTGAVTSALAEYKTRIEFSEADAAIFAAHSLNGARLMLKQAEDENAALRELITPQTPNPQTGGSRD